MIYLITYNINKTLRDYTTLYNAIKVLGVSYWHLQESTWFVAANSLNIVDATTYLRSFIYPGDSIFVVELHPSNMVEGWVTRNFWEWYKNNI